MSGQRYADGDSIFRWPITKDGERVRLSCRTLVGLLVLSYGLGVGLILAADTLPAIVRVPPVVLVLTFVPGSLFLLSVSDGRELGAKWVVYAAGTSLVLLMLLGLASNIALPPLGIGQPISTRPLIAALSLLVVVLAVTAIAARGKTELQVLANSPLSPAPLAFAHLPLLSAFGVLLLNRTGENRLLVAVLLVIAVLPLLVYLFVDERWHGFGIWTMAMAVLYHDTLYVGSTFAGSPYVVRIWQAGRWVPGTRDGGPLSTELLQHGTIFPAYAHLTDLNIMTQMLVVNPFFVSLIPVALFVAFRNYVTSKLAFLGASIFVFAHPFYIQYPPAGRSATPVLFLAMFAALLNDQTFSRRVRSGLALLFIAGIVFTHYGTSYFMLVALVGTIAVGIGLRTLDLSLFTLAPSNRLTRKLTSLVEIPARTKGLVSWSMRWYFVVATFSWYLFTNGGRAFALFPRHFTRVLDQFLGGSAGIGAGRTGARLQRDYGSIAITYSKRIYMILGMLMVIGIAITLFMRLRENREYELDDHFFALGVTMLGLFFLTIVVRTWGGGRPMMITFVFTLLFAIIGVSWTGLVWEWIGKEQLEFLPARQSQIVSGFAVLIAVLFVLNSGVVTALGFAGQAPSNVPASDGKTFKTVDVASHAWIIDHRDEGKIYGDDKAFGQTDWYAPAIAARTKNGEVYGGVKPRNKLEPLTHPEAETGHLLLLGHNVATGQLDRGTHVQPISDILPRYQRNKVYTTGQTKVFYFDKNGRQVNSIQHRK